MKRIEIIFGIIRIPLDFFLTITAFLAAYHVRTEEKFFFLFGAPTGPIEPLSVYLQFAIFAALLLLGIFAIDSMYSLKSTFRFKREIRKIIFLCLTWFMALIAYFFIVRIQFFSRLILGYTLIFTVTFIIISRIILRLIQRLTLLKGIGKRRIVIIGSNKISEELYQIFSKNPSYKVVGVIAEKQRANMKTLGNIKDLETILRKQKIDEVVQTQSHLSEEKAADILETCRVNHVAYKFVPDLIQVQRTNIELNFFRGIPVIALKETPLDAWGRVAKRIFDFIVSITITIILSPVFILVAIFIKIDSRGPVLYKSKRVSAKGRPFSVYKFRSMIINAEDLKRNLEHLNHRKGPLFKIKNDPRITRFGAFLRKTSIDELPQLFNVIKGDMSLVGPRPHLVEEVAMYKKHHKKVLAIKPGITGIAQISGRSDLDFEEEVKLDTYYIENWSLLFDIIILLKTIPVVFKGSAAD
jgi:exopolysaccharide biosynthesis polyprenyl glycosylphosphotransferase